MNHPTASCRIGLGTAQFGMNYGISNVIGKNTHGDISGILKRAEDLGLRLLDTSPAYGDSEEALGQCQTTTAPFSITTKTPTFGHDDITQNSADLLIASFMQSLKHLNREKLYGLLIHDADNLLVTNGSLLVEAMQELKRRGLVDKIGVSVYSSGHIDSLLDVFMPDIIQLPINVFDQRLVESGHLIKLKQLNIEIHARSVFLQGLLLMSLEDLPPWFNAIRSHISDYYSCLSESGISRLVAALTFVRDIKEIDCILVGVNSVDHVTDIVQAYRNGIGLDVSRFAILDEQYINPIRWQVQ